MTTEKRPEKFEDLPQDEYDTRPVELMVFTIEWEMFGGVLGHVDEVVTSLKAVYDGVTVVKDGDTVKVGRPRNDAEQAQALENHQRRWDLESREAAASEARASLSVGDPLEPVTGPLRCSKINRAVPNCDLNYDHKGDHISIVGGVIASRTARP